jgi:hypothetical protein
VPRLPGRLPLSLGVPGGQSGGALYTRSNVAYNYSIGGLPFLSAASRERPYIRQTAEYRKQQFDNSGEPGEQSLVGWWLRSQSSFHGGAGQLFGDPNPTSGGVDYSSIRYWDSEGVDPWTPGSVSLLRSTTQVAAVPILEMVPYTNAGTAETFGISSANPYTFNGTAGGISELNPSAKALQSVAYDGSKLYVSALDGIWSRAKAGGAYTKIWNIATDQVNKIKWIKQRLVLAASSGVYELTGAGPALPVAKWVAPTAGWTPSGIAESANSIYVAGNSGMDGFVLRFTLDTAGVMPTVTGGSVVANLPFGETITSMYGYLGTYLALGTSRGARIARIDTSGAIEVGPLLWEGQVNGWYARDRFLFATGSTQSGGPGLYRVDLSTELSNLRFAYAADLWCVGGGATVYSVCGQGSSERLLVGCINGVYAEKDTYVDTGWVQSSRIRFATLEPKVFKLLRLRAALLVASARLSLVDADGVAHTVVGFGAGQTPGTEDVVLPDLGPQDYVSILIELDSDDLNVSTSALTGWQLKGLPATPRERVIQVPLLCFDAEKDRHGVRAGGAGTALTRLEALESLERDADVLAFQDLDLGRTTRVVIEQMNFTQTTPPAGTDGWGGIITLTLRTV